MAVSLRNIGDFLNWWFKVERLEPEASYVFNRYYRKYRNNFNGYLRFAWNDRHLELEHEIEVMKARSNVRMIDLGCGTGTVCLYVAFKLEDNVEVLGIDIKKNRLSCAKDRKLVLERETGKDIRCNFRELNVLSLDNNQKFDLIYMEEAFHHMEPRLKIISKIADLLKEKGILIISDVNAYNPFMQLSLFWKRGFKTRKRVVGEDGEIFYYGIERIIRAKRVEKFFRQKGLKKKSVRYFRIANSKLAVLADKHNFDLINLEKKICKMGIVPKIFSIHYNIVFQK